MFFIITWWIIIAIMLALFIISYLVDKKTKSKIDKYIGFFVIIQLLVLLVTIATKDPLFEPIGLPKEYEWLGGLLIAGGSLWFFYLNPLKERVITTEKKVERIDERTSALPKINEDVSWIRNNCKICKK